MARTDTLGNFLTDVASAIKTKKGSQTAIQASNFDTEIINLPSGEVDINWGIIGYSASPQAVHNIYDYSKDIYDNWDANNPVKFTGNTNLQVMPFVDTSKMTSMQDMFSGCTNLTDVPNLDTSSSTTFRAMFNNCTNLKTIDISGYDTSQWEIGVKGSLKETFKNCTSLESVNFGDFTTTTFNPYTNNIYNMFYNCPNLNDTTLNDALRVAIIAGQYMQQSEKKLSYLGFSSSLSTQWNKFPTLSNWQDFLDAGWTYN